MQSEYRSIPAPQRRQYGKNMQNLIAIPHGHVRGNFRGCIAGSGMRREAQQKTNPFGLQDIESRKAHGIGRAAALKGTSLAHAFAVNERAPPRPLFRARTKFHGHVLKAYLSRNITFPSGPSLLRRLSLPIQINPAFCMAPIPSLMTTARVYPCFLSSSTAREL